MASTLFVKLQPKQGWFPLTQIVRHGSKAVTRHRKPMHFVKQKLMAVTEYIPPARHAPPGAYPSEVEEVKEESPLLLFLKKNAQKVFQECKMIAVVQNNACNAEDMVILKQRLHKYGMFVKLFPNQVMLSFLKDTKYSNMAPLFIGPNLLIVSKETKAKELMMILRTSPQITLLGACIEDTLMSAQGVMSYAKLPSYTVVQGDLVSGLTMLTSCTAFMLQHYPSHLSALLQQYVKQEATSDGHKEGAPTTEEAT